jgi:hypothetical protein
VTVDEAEEAEKIEVHVHLHRDGSKRARAKRPAPPVLTGTLFEWQWYKDQLCKRPRTPGRRRRWLSLATTCQTCDGPIPSTATRCPRCNAPRTRRRFLPAVIAVIGLASIAIVFALCAHVLGDSVPEHRAPAPVGNWSDDGVVIVEVPVSTPSPFTAPIDVGHSGSGSGTATR